MKSRKINVYVGDFETTVYEGQERTDVWASALVQLYTDDVTIYHTIGDTLEAISALPSRSIIYYHNLKFDGAFWLDYLMQEKGFILSGEMSEDCTDFHYTREREMSDNTIITSISDMGAWYRIVFKYKGKLYELRDSLKLLPFSVEVIGKSFGTKHKKLNMEYTGYRYPGCEITDEEKKYIANDVLVVKEALEIMYDQGHNKLTIGSCCLSEYKEDYRYFDDYDNYFPNLYEQLIDSDTYGSISVGDYIHNAYRGGWCYLVPSKKGIHYNGFTADVNSLYPSVMHSESGSKYPYADGVMWKGNYIPDWAKLPDRYFYVRFSCEFELKEGYLPFIQIKKDIRYKATDMLTTSRIWDSKQQRYCSYIKWFDGSVSRARVTMTVTETDWYLINEHYNLYNLEILDGVVFYAQTGLFDRYINKYRKIKQESTGAVRTLAKLFLNNLYGKMAASTDSSFKIPIVIDGVVRYGVVKENEKTPGYIAIGAAITSYARNFTIRAAQKNYHGESNPGFIYADTDSIHCDIPLSEVKGITVHPSNFCCWKIENEWDIGMFTRQKTYIEHTVKEDGEDVDPYYMIKCAGMPKKCKKLLDASLRGVTLPGLTDYERAFVEVKRELSDFDLGLCVPGKLLPKRIPGGIILVETDYEMR